MGEFMGDDHSQKRFGCRAEEAGNADLVFGFESSPLYPRNEGMGSQGGGEVAHLGIVMDFGDRRGITEMAVFEFSDVPVQRFIGGIRMEGRVSAQEVLAQFSLLDEGLNLRTDGLVITVDVF